MEKDSAVKLFYSLPENFQYEVVHLIEFLAKKAGLSKNESSKDAPKSLFGHAKGQIYIAPDFDEPLEDFIDYT